MFYKFEGRSPVMGKETYVSKLAEVIGDVEIGDNCYIGHGAILRGDYGRIVIGDGTAVEEGVIIHAPPGETSNIGERVTLGHGAIIHSEKIGNLVVVGMGAILSIRCQVGEGAIVGEGAVVTLKQVVPPNVVAVGNPARVVREVSEKDRKLWNWGKELYIDLAKRYLARPMEEVHIEPGKSS